jgi:hypothetical protein
MKPFVVLMLSLMLAGCPARQQASEQAPIAAGQAGVVGMVPGSGVVRQTSAPVQCSKEELLGYSPKRDELLRHRTQGPVVNYPFGTVMPDGGWGVDVSLRIDELGRVACYGANDQFDRPIRFTAERIAALRDLNYQPFLLEGRAVSAVATEEIREQELPVHLAMPSVPLDKVHIALERSGCFGTCPSYRVDIFGDGRAVYRGRGFVDVEGEHHYRVSREAVSDLVQSLRAKDIWSMRPSYRGMVTDNPSYQLTIQLGDAVHQIDDYVGAMAGMPIVVTDFEDQVDKVAKSAMWINLSTQGMKLLEEEDFPFNSPAGAALLRRALANDAADDAAAVRLIELGAPLISATKPTLRSSRRPLLMEALRNRHASAVAALIERGALVKDGRVDHASLDTAFRAAIEGGRLALVKQIWDSGGGVRPALYFDDIGDGGGDARVVPIALALRVPYSNKGDWQGLEIAQWLQGQGCDLTAHAANGATLLHIATEASDRNFVAYLLSQGVDPSTPGEFGLPALGGARDEDIAMMLIQAGTDLSMMDEDGKSFRKYAAERHWMRVLALLTKNGKAL